MNDPTTKWRALQVASRYGQGTRLIEIVSGTALWHHPGRQVLIRYVLVRDPAAQFRPQAFLCTDPDHDPVDILRWFVRRWSIEVTFAEVRRHLGVETQRQWSGAAIARTTPCLLALFSLVTLWVAELPKSALQVRAGIWYPIPRPTLSDALAAIRRELWCDQFKTSPSHADMVKIPPPILARLKDLACHPT